MAASNEAVVLGTIGADTSRLVCGGPQTGSSSLSAKPPPDCIRTLSQPHCISTYSNLSLA